MPLKHDPIRIPAICDRTAGVNQAVAPSITPSAAPTRTPVSGLFMFPENLLHLYYGYEAVPLTLVQVYMYIPPFTASTWPVMYDASSLARNFTAAAISSGLPMRARGMEASIFCLSS